MKQIPEIDPSEVVEFEVLGEGSYGTVSRGRCRGMEVAIKRLLKPIVDSRSLNNFRAEVNVMCSFNHPNICLFMGACTKSGNFFIVEEFLNGGDVEKVLAENGRNIPLYTRMSWAMDAALGMNWLHQNNPIFIHRDLKTSNLLIDENNRVKVCDFGLSEMKKSGQMLQDKESAKGTPLWMAPEVMDFHRFNEKADVYSYGIVLWELLTCEKPFSSFTQNFNAFKEAICRNRYRPIIPDDCEDSLKNLIENCWCHNPTLRPSFEEIINKLKNVIIDVAIKDPYAREFWKQEFYDCINDENLVLYDDFEKKFFSFIGVPSSELIAPDDVVVTMQHSRCMKLILQTLPEVGIKGKVSLTQFGLFTDYFGPILPVDTTPWKENIIASVKSLMDLPWFHGNTVQKSAEQLLSTQEDGTFLIRYSSKPGWFCLSQVNSGKIKHTRIKHEPGESYIFSTNEYESLQSLVQENQLDLPCPGSPFFVPEGEYDPL